MVTSAKVHKNLLFRLQKDRNNVKITKKKRHSLTGMPLISN